MHSDADRGAGLAATRAELAALPAPTAPPELHARWLAALAADDGSAEPRILRSPAPAGVFGALVRRRLARTTLVAPALAAAALAAAALAAAVLVTVILAGAPSVLAPGDSRLPARLALSTATLADADAAGLATHGLGPFGTPERLHRCLAAAGLPPTAALGARDVLLDGRPAVLLVLPWSAERLRLVVVLPGCGATEAGGHPVLADTTVER